MEIPETAASAIGPGLPNYANQTIVWSPCAERTDAECGSVVLPLDYARPSAASITMPLIRIAATDPAQRLGTLTGNPGGPGESGFDMVLGSDDDLGLKRLRERYDLVGWDPRGIGRTAGIHCLSDSEMDEYEATNFSPIDKEGQQAVANAQRRFAEGCQRNAGQLLGFVGAEVVAQDLDVLRSALGEDFLNYIGYSFGTLIGQHYVQQFPERVGRMVLDSVADPAEGNGSTLDYDGSDPSPASEDNADDGDDLDGDLDDQDKQLQAILDGCAADPVCPLGQDPQRQFNELLATVTANPVPLPDGRALGLNSVITAAVQATYQEEYWPRLTQGIADALNGDGATLIELADEFNGRDSEGHYDHKRDGFWAVTCLNGDPATFRTRSDEEILAALNHSVGQYEKNAPILGRNETYGNSMCDFWPVPPTHPASAIVVENAPPILLVNNIGDPATTLQAAQKVSESLANSVLVLNDRTDHIAFGKGSKCIDDIVVNYFFAGTMPPPDVQCAGN
jgi:pimeloyl-ACP methyl ester carboxylesterase